MHDGCVSVAVTAKVPFDTLAEARRGEAKGEENRSDEDVGFDVKRSPLNLDERLPRDRAGIRLIP